MPPPDEKRYSSVLSTCAQECELGGLDFSTVLQEMLIEGKRPIYLAIVTRDKASENTRDSLVFALLDACRPLSSATINTIRLACMVASDNVFLQELFKDIPPLSPLSAKDVLLLGPNNLRDHVDVHQKLDGTGPFVAYIRMPRFRLRLRILDTLAVEFAASHRIWMLKFRRIVKTAAANVPPVEMVSPYLELGKYSLPTAVNASLSIPGSSHPGENRGRYLTPSHTFSFGCTHKLSPGRLLLTDDDGTCLLHESVDSSGTFHARLESRYQEAYVTLWRGGEIVDSAGRTPARGPNAIPDNKKIVAQSDAASISSSIVPLQPRPRKISAALFRRRACKKKFSL
ncbi:hypothetical protein BGW80DRAFT_214714 [Lactifluus volemus]|nr:hypothetical protein BGW80DRAFT_214714 [Lactifluus volemus]